MLTGAAVAVVCATAFAPGAAGLVGLGLAGAAVVLASATTAPRRGGGKHGLAAWLPVGW